MSDPATDSELRPRRRVGRFELFSEIASGGMATVHLGRLIGASDFSRIVAIKRLHPQYAKNPEFVQQFLDEARIVARIRHPSVLPTLDLIEEEGELFIVMEFVEGDTLVNLMRAGRKRGDRVPLGVGLRIMCGALHGLHAAHEARNEDGEPMGIVHRDVSPDNIMVGTDGFARVLDFGIARALGVHSQTQDGVVKGKLPYMSPEQVLGDPITRATDVFAASAVLWQVLTGRRLFKGKHVGEYAQKILNQPIPPPSKVLGVLPKKLDMLVLRGLKRDPAERWSTAQRMAEALEAVGDLASQREVGNWVGKLAFTQLRNLAEQVKAIERAPRGVPPRSEPPPAGDAQPTAAEAAVADLRPAGAAADAPRTPMESGVSLRPTPEAASVGPMLATPAPELGISPARDVTLRRWLIVAGAAVVSVITLVIIWLAASASTGESAQETAQEPAQSSDPAQTAPPEPTATADQEPTTQPEGSPTADQPDEAATGEPTAQDAGQGGADADEPEPEPTTQPSSRPTATRGGTSTWRGPRTGPKGTRTGLYSRQ